MPDLETFWRVKTPGDGERIGVAWQAGYSYTLERHAGDALIDQPAGDALIDQPAAIGTPLERESPSGPISGTGVSRPLVPDSATGPRSN